MQDACANGLSAGLIGETEKRLRFWAERSRLVVTRHNHLPHDAVKDPMWEKMYEIFYRHVDGVAHFAGASVAEFRQRYRDTAYYRDRAPLHTVIAHQNYASLPNRLSRGEARARLRIDAKAKVMLVFGAIRNFEERDLILRTFRDLKVAGKVLLVSRWREKLAGVSWIRLKYWLRDLARLYYRLHPRYHFNYGFVEEADTQIYLNAADVLFIPRLRVLNSGNITLGMTFGRVVVGPDSWDVGELLRETGNPVFDPARPETAADAVEEGFRMAREGSIGPANQQRAMRDWGADRCAVEYLKFYDAVNAGRLATGAIPSLS
jgi:glycosyltransferase involved in cell wall biosynthesis